MLEVVFMNDLKEAAASKVLRIILYIIFVLGVAATVSMPFMIDTYMRVLRDAHELREGYRTFITIFLMIIGILGLFIVFELIIMMRTILKDPFVKRNVKSLNIIGIAGFIAAACFFVKCLFYLTFMTLLFGIFLVILGLFALTLAHLFNKAVEYKEENDLTI